jgi:hypothetical protein
MHGITKVEQTSFGLFLGYLIFHRQETIALVFKFGKQIWEAWN